jgi:hypothetical protein
LPDLKVPTWIFIIRSQHQMYWCTRDQKSCEKSRGIIFHECSTHFLRQTHICAARNDVTFHDVQCIFHNWMNLLAWVIENAEEYTLE